jgi:hypothetical protein
MLAASVSYFLREQEYHQETSFLSSNDQNYAGLKTVK